MTNQTTNGTVLLKFIKTADQKSPLTWVPYLEKGPLQMFSVVMSLITSYLAKYSQLPLSVKNWKLERKTDLPIWNMLVLHVESFESKNVQFIFCRAKLYWELWPCWCINVCFRPPDPYVMVYSQDGDHEWDRSQELDQWVLICFAEKFILVRDLDKDQAPLIPVVPVPFPVSFLVVVSCSVNKPLL